MPERRVDRERRLGLYEVRGFPVGIQRARIAGLTRQVRSILDELQAMDAEAQAWQRDAQLDTEYPYRRSA